MVPWGGGQGQLGKRELLVGYRRGELLRREERGAEKGEEERRGLEMGAGRGEGRGEGRRGEERRREERRGGERRGGARLTTRTTTTRSPSSSKAQLSGDLLQMPFQIHLGWKHPFPPFYSPSVFICTSLCPYNLFTLYSPFE